MFDTWSLMTTLSPDVTAALATLRTRWGAAAPRAASEMPEVAGALALAPAAAPAATPAATPEIGAPAIPADPARIFSTGFPDLDAILGPGGLPRGTGLVLRGDLSSGRTTVALRLAAAAQAAGAIVAWLDLASAFDPVEAVARGIDPEWLVVLTPATADEGIVLAASLLTSHTVDLLVLDLPSVVDGAARFADRLGRLAALARRSGIGLVAIENPDLPGPIAGAVGEGTGVRLELVRRSWIQLGRDVVGQAVEARVERSRIGPPGRRATLRILYADGGERDACLAREDLLGDAPPLPIPRPVATELPRTSPRPAAAPRPTSADRARAAPRPHLVSLPVPAPADPVPGNARHAPAPPLSAAPPPRPRPPAPRIGGFECPAGSESASAPAVGPRADPRLGKSAGPGQAAGHVALAGRTGRDRRPAVDRRERAGRERSSPGARGPARDAARVGAPPGA